MTPPPNTTFVWVPVTDTQPPMFQNVFVLVRFEGERGTPFAAIVEAFRNNRLKWLLPDGQQQHPEAKIDFWAISPETTVFNDDAHPQ